MEDSQIVSLFGDRREAALEETEKKYGPYLNQVAYRILGSREDVEEVLSDPISPPGTASHRRNPGCCGTT